MGIVSQCFKAIIPHNLVGGHDFGHAHLPSRGASRQVVFPNGLVALAADKQGLCRRVIGDTLCVAGRNALAVYRRIGISLESLHTNGLDVASRGVLGDAEEEETVLRFLVADHGITVTAQRSDAAVIGRADGPPAQADLFQFHGLLCRQAASSQQGKGGAC